jgi:low temperature requirement protein LtrA
MAGEHVVGARTVLATDASARVTPIELFFDLVFVYALTQVTSLLATDISAIGFARGLIVLALVWWCWVGYSWLGNVAQADEGLLRLAFFVVMMALFVMAIAIPESFDDLSGGLDGPLVFVACYAVVHLVHLGLFWVAAADDTGLRKQLLRFAPTVVTACVLLTGGALLGPPWQLPLWTAALVVDLGGTLAAGASGWRLPSPGHFSERHGLIIIIALGESIVAIGVGVTELPVSWPVVVASVIGIAVAAGLWWLYFDVIALVAERVLAQLEGTPRARLARDGFTYLHLPMVAGIVVTALGLKKTLEYVGGGHEHEWTDSLAGLAGWALPIGVGLYVLAQVGFRLRIGKPISWPALVAVCGLVAVGLVGPHISVLLTLALVAVVVAALVAFETITHAEAREQLRHEHHQHHEPEHAG